MYAKRNTKEWNTFFNLLTEGNKLQAKNAAVFVVIASRKNFEHNEKSSITHQFDAGAVWENLALEASIQGIVSHGMQRFNYQKDREDLNIPNSFDVLAMSAIGKKVLTENLPPKLQQMEFPNDRKPLNKIIMEGYFKDE